MTKYYFNTFIRKSILKTPTKQHKQQQEKKTKQTFPHHLYMV